MTIVHLYRGAQLSGSRGSLDSKSTCLASENDEMPVSAFEMLWRCLSSEHGEVSSVEAIVAKLTLARDKGSTSIVRKCSLSTYLGDELHEDGFLLFGFTCAYQEIASNG